MKGCAAQKADDVHGAPRSHWHVLSSALLKPSGRHSLAQACTVSCLSRKGVHSFQCVASKPRSCTQAGHSWQRDSGHSARSTRQLAAVRMVHAARYQWSTFMLQRLLGTSRHPSLAGSARGCRSADSATHLHLDALKFNGLHHILRYNGAHGVATHVLFLVALHVQASGRRPAVAHRCLRGGTGQQAAANAAAAAARWAGLAADRPRLAQGAAASLPRLKPLLGLGGGTPAHAPAERHEHPVH